MPTPSPRGGTRWANAQRVPKLGHLPRGHLQCFAWHVVVEPTLTVARAEAEPPAPVHLTE